MDGVVVLDEALRDAVAKRDAQGREMYAYYKAHFTSVNDPSDKIIATYTALEDKNREVCRVVDERDRDLVRMRDAALRIGPRTPADEAGAAALAEALRATLTRLRATIPRTRVFQSLEGPFVVGIEPDLEKSALKGESREERTAALRCLAQLGPKIRLDVLRPCLEDQDPYVRRATFATYAANATRDAVDALVARTASEIGVPSYDLQRALLRLTGQCLGDSGKAWADWWSGAREAWNGPPEVPPAVPDRKRAGTKYFGLSLDSTRVLFVVDRSWSMDWPVAYDGRNAPASLAGESKINVARRELIQAVTGLPEGSSFNIVAFGTSTKPYSPKLVEATQENRKHAKFWIQNLELEGSTNMSGALIDAFESLLPGPCAKDAEIADTIVVMTDGIPNCGPITDEDDVLAEIRRRNRDHAVTIDCVYLGNEGNVKFLTQLASENGGQFVHVDK